MISVPLLPAQDLLISKASVHRGYALHWQSGSSTGISGAIPTIDQFAAGRVIHSQCHLGVTIDLFLIRIYAVTAQFIYIHGIDAILFPVLVVSLGVSTGTAFWNLAFP